MQVSALTDSDKSFSLNEANAPFANTRTYRYSINGALATVQYRTCS